MVRIEIVESLVNQIKKKFNKSEANKFLDVIATVEQSPSKAKILGTVGGIVIKEIKYKNF
ncbi:MAG: hypothetical protein ACOCQQ_01150 [Candidatus Nanoarchaeia archaeon]